MAEALNDDMENMAFYLRSGQVVRDHRAAQLQHSRGQASSPSRFSYALDRHKYLTVIDIALHLALLSARLYSTV